jgi:hypothetical protein
MDVLSTAWATNVDQVDACRALDIKLRDAVKAMM